MELINKILELEKVVGTLDTPASKRFLEAYVNQYVEEIIYNLSRTKINDKFPFGDLIQYYRLPEEYKYVFGMKYKDMDDTEKYLSYKSKLELM